MALELKNEKEPICTIKTFLDVRNNGIGNGGFNYHAIDPQKQERKSTKFQNGIVIRNGMGSLQNGGAKLSNGMANGTLKNATILNGTANGSIFKHNGSYEDFDDKKGKDDDSVELDFSTSSFMQSEEDTAMDCTRNRVTLIKTIMCGQILSLTLCGVGTTSAALAKWYNVRIPGFQAFLTYSVLALTAGTKLAFDSGRFREVIKKRGWKYILLGVIDVEANFLLVKAYTFTTLTSAQLCDSFTIPTVLILSCLFLRVRYKASHYIGVVLCVGGAICLIFTDTRDVGSNARNELVGDFLSLSGAFLYGCSNVAQEFVVRSFTKTEFLGMIGIVCSVVSGIQSVAIERDVIYNIEWTWHVVLLIICFVICQYMYYTLMPWVITLSSATVVNLSLLTSDLYTLMFGLFLFGYKFSYLYFVAFGGIFLGLIIYNWKPAPVSPKRTRRAREEVESFCNENPLNEKQKLCEEKDKVSICHFNKYTNGNINGIINTEV